MKITYTAPVIYTFTGNDVYDALRDFASHKDMQFPRRFQESTVKTKPNNVVEVHFEGVYEEPRI